MPSLKLAALDAEDLAIVSAHAQDAVLRLGDIEWQPREKRFLMPVNRFVWETASGYFRKSFERRRAVLHFDRVMGVKSTRVPLSNKESVMDLLAIGFEEGEAPSGTIRLTFAGGGEIRLSVECIEVRLTDLGAAWATTAKPDHAG
jgi:hypothetical protein